MDERDRIVLECRGSDSSQGLAWWVFTFFRFLPQSEVYGDICHSQLLETDFFTQIYIALIHGLAKCFMKGRLLQPQTETMAPTQNPQHHTWRFCYMQRVGMFLLLVLMLLHYKLSLLGSLGAFSWWYSSRSNSSKHRHTLFRWLWEIPGLRQKKMSVLNTIKQWDEKIFSIESSRLQNAMDLLLADSEGEPEDDEMEDQDGNGPVAASPVWTLWLCSSCTPCSKYMDLAFFSVWNLNIVLEIEHQSQIIWNLRRQCDLRATL